MQAPACQGNQPCQVCKGLRAIPQTKDGKTVHVVCPKCAGSGRDGYRTK